MNTRFYYMAKGDGFGSSFTAVLLDLETGETKEEATSYRNGQTLVAAMDERFQGEATRLSPKHFQRQADIRRPHSPEMLALLEKNNVPNTNDNLVECYVYGSKHRPYNHVDLRSIQGEYRLIQSDRDRLSSTIGKGYYTFVVMLEIQLMTVEEQERYELDLVSGPGLNTKGNK